MILLRLISWQYARKHKVRMLLTTAGIVLGVAVFVGMHTANQSVLFAFQKTIDRIAGATQLQVTAGEPGFDEDVLEKIQGSPSVRVAVPILESTVTTNLPGQGNLLILGVDMTGDRSLREYDLESGGDDAVEDPLVFLAQPDSLIITKPFADKNGLHVGSKLPMGTMQGEKQFTVRGIMRSGGLTSAFGGNLAVMDIYAAQHVFGRGRKFDRVDIGLKEDLTLDAGRAELEALLGPGFTVEPPSSRGQQFESTAAIYSLVSGITSVFALFIGMFIIYNTFAIAVTQRRSEIGILRALGATRRQIRTLFLTESALTGLFGSLLGLLFGILIARALAGYLSALLGELYGIGQRAEEIALDPKLILFAVAIGVITSVIAGVLPARQAAAVDPVRALQKGRQQSLSEGENRVRRFAAAGCAALALVCVLFSKYRPAFYAGFLLAVLAALLLSPALSLWISRGLRPILKWLRPVEGALAADSLIQAPRRTSGTVAALMLSLALVISLAGVARASYDSIKSWLDIALNPDLFVTTSQSITARSFVFPAAIGEELKKIPGVEEVQFVRTVRVDVPDKKNGGKSPIIIVAVPIIELQKRIMLAPLAGDAGTMYELTREGKGVLASDNFALLHGYQLGDQVDIATPRGMLKLPILGIVTDYSDQQGSLLMDRSVFIKAWNDDTVNVFRLYLKRGASESAVREDILAKLGTVHRLFVFTNKELRAYVLRLTDQWFGLTYVQIAVAVLVAVLGIVNALTVSIVDRRRELGVLQAVGAMRNQIRHTIWMEALAIGIIGLVLGLALGAVQLYYTVEIARRDLAGIRLDYVYPFAILAALLPVILAAAFLAAIGPAESAVRGSLVEALEYE
ncbi:MAG: FtsX-like permease family protein [Bryobacteraceae bacterium]